jgi:hypothetical protein
VQRRRDALLQARHPFLETQVSRGRVNPIYWNIPSRHFCVSYNGVVASQGVFQSRKKFL